MFRQYISHTGTTAGTLFQQHPDAIGRLLETAWRDRVLPALTSAPFPANPTFLHPAYAAGSLTLGYEHLIYAYLVENTRIYDIFRRVVTELVQGERLDTPSWEGQRWLRTTEELFFRDPPSFLAITLNSQMRSDLNATRRNAYYRLFGLDLNHGTDDNKPYPYVKPTAANKEFIPTLELLLMEVWRGITNATNTSGPRDTDNEALGTLATRLRDMLTVRRQNGNLSREEFWFTAMMSWFHLTIESNTPIIVDLGAEATSASERLHKIGERVKLPSHGRAQAFFDLADATSIFLRNIEANAYTTSTSAQALYNPPVADTMIRIVTQYSVATGRDLKARSVVVQKR
jgi:hypothetical protein